MPKSVLVQNKIYGFSLLEVLIATFVLACGLLEVIGVYIHSLKSTEESYRRTIIAAKIIEAHETH